MVFFLYAIESISGIYIAESRPPFHRSPCPLQHDRRHYIFLSLEKELEA